MFHLAWFANPRPHGWTPTGPDRWAGNDVKPALWETGEFMIDFAKSLERACFDYIMLEDHVVLKDDKETNEPRLDPMPVLSMIAAHTQYLGLVGTFSTSFYPPFLLARQMATLDHLSRGRAGWNMVTSGEDRGAQAFGNDKQPPHDERYDRADEYLDLADQLWRAWEPDAYEMNEETGRYVDPVKVREFEFKGKWLRSRGPLNVGHSPQGRPVLCQAGASGRGRDFAASHADTIICSTFGENSVPALKEFRDDIRARMRNFGRDPDSCKVMYLISPVLGDSESMAHERYWQIFEPTPGIINQRLNQLSTHTAHDWYQYDLDKPLPPMDVATMTQGYQGMAAGFIKLGDGGKRTLREMIADYQTSSLKLVGTPAQIADRLAEVIEETGGDGFLLHARPLTRRYITEICDGLVPLLQKRGLVRGEYGRQLFRDNLLAF
jgi:FMN-dependent oxidoreductase (nitrilotriacetate monooxygenase family)